MNTFIHVVSWRFRNCHVSALIENNLLLVIYVLNTLVMILTWTFLFLYKTVSLCFVHIYLIVWTAVYLFSHLLLLSWILIVLTYALNIKRSHVFSMSGDPNVCTWGDYYFLGNVRLSYQIVLHCRWILSLVLTRLLPVVERVAGEMLTTNLLLVDATAVLFAHRLADSVGNAVYHL